MVTGFYYISMCVIKFQLFLPKIDEDSSIDIIKINFDSVDDVISS